MNSVEPKYEDAYTFFRLMSKQYFKYNNFSKGYLELRMKVPDDWKEKKEYYTNFERFSRANIDIITKKGCQIFIQFRKDAIEDRFKDFRKFVEWNNYWFMNNVRVFYGAAFRKKYKGEIGGGYDYISRINLLYFDLDKKDHSNLLEHEMENMRIYTGNVADIIMNTLHIFYGPYLIVNSGAGRHIIYLADNIKITDGRKRWYKKYVKVLKQKVKDRFIGIFDNFEVDGITDFTRVLGLPGSMNTKRGVRVKIIHINEEAEPLKKMRSLAAPKVHASVQEQYENLPPVRESLEWQVMTHPKVPKGEIHSVVLFALKLYLKAKGIEDWQILQKEMNAVRKSNHKLNPYYGTEGKNYSPGVIINWCKRNQEWCERYSISIPKYLNNKQNL